MQIIATGSLDTTELGVSSVSDGLAFVLEGGTLRLIYLDQDSNRIYSTTLATGTTGASGVLADGTATGNWSAVQPGEGMALLTSGSQTRVFVFSDPGAALTTSVIGANGAPGTATTVQSSEGALYGVTNLTTLDLPGADLVVTSTYGTSGVQIYTADSTGFLTLIATIEDEAKAHLGDVTDLELITIDGQTYLLTLSALESGLTCYLLDDDGKATLHDSIGTHDGLNASGCAAMQVVDVAGVTYVLVASTTSSSLSVVRINDQGCLFTVDTLNDDTTTRFAGVQAFDTFTYAGRTFIVAAGTDAGVSILEVMPGGELEVIHSAAFETGAGMDAVTSVEVAVSGSTAAVYLVDAGSDQILTFTISLTNIGGILYASAGTATGTSKDDVLIGGSGGETLSGGSGADRIYDGAGADTLTGGAGADVFILGADTSTDRITDYNVAEDQIDLSAWGRIYTADVLTITATSTGCTISYGTNSLTVTSSTGTSLTAASFGADDFIFA